MQRRVRGVVLATAVALLATVATPAQGDDPAPPDEITTDVRVGRTQDDAEEATFTGIVTRSSADLELVDDAGVVQTVGVRFADLGLPRGAVVRRAWIQFTADEVQFTPTDLVIAAHDVDNAPKLGPNEFNLTSRNLTSATAAWSPPPWTTVGEAGDDQRTPDLQALVQEVVDRPYWAGVTGAMAFTFTGTGQRTAVAFDQDPARAPALHIDWSPGTPTPYAPAVHRFAAFGDYGNGGTNEGRVANLVNSLGVDAVLTTGDNSYGSNFIDENIGRHYLPYLGSYRGGYGSGAPANRFWPSLGNHDYTDGGGLAAYRNYFTLPGHERYYDVVLGPVHVFALNSDAREPDGIGAASAQATWLRQGLAASTSPWQIVLLHHSPFSSGAHGPAPTLQWPFAAWGVDAVLSGHDHDYERLEVDGIPYIVTGLGGVSRNPRGAVDPHSAFYTYTDDGALLLEACPGRLAFSFHTVWSGVVDTRAVGGPTCDPPTVSVEATDSDASEAGVDPGELSVVRTGSTDRALSVHYTVSGTATASDDYSALPGTVVIPAGADRAPLAVVPVDDPAVEDDESVVVDLIDGTDHDLGPTATAAVTLRSDDVAWVVRDVHPTAQQRVFGTVTGGTLTSLRASDNQRLNLREALSAGGSPTSQVEYRFPFTVPVFRQLTVVVEAHHSVNSEGDDLLVDWSRNGGPWHTIVTVRKTADNGTAQFANLPSWVTSGDAVSLRVRDANRTGGRSQLDTMSVDRLFLRATVPA